MKIAVFLKLPTEEKGNTFVVGYKPDVLRAIQSVVHRRLRCVPNLNSVLSLGNIEIQIGHGEGIETGSGNRLKKEMHRKGA